jgi:hypothetical protein
MSLRGLVAQKGAPATFTHSTPGTYDPATDTTSNPVVVTVEGWAIEAGNDPLVFQAAELVLTDQRTLEFTPKVRGVLPALGSAIVWAGITFTVVRIPDRLAMAGIDDAALIIVGR